VTGTITEDLSYHKSGQHEFHIENLKMKLPVDKKVITPFIAKRIYRNKSKIMGQPLIETSCAQLLIILIIAYIFGDISVVPFMTNLLVLPLVPMLMAATFLAGMTDIIIPSMAGLVIVWARWLLVYIISATNLLSTFSGAIVKLNISLFQLVICYGLIIVCA